MISIVLPFYNEEESAAELIRQVCAAASKIGAPYEVIAVDDGSSDSTKDIIAGLSEEYPAVIPSGFEKNSGQAASLAEGFRVASGEIIVSMDGDLQDDPEEIPEMVKTFEAVGCDVLCGYRAARKDSTKIKIISRAANFFQRLILGLELHDISCTYRVYRKEAAKSLKLERRGLHRFIPYLLKRNGFTLAEREVHNCPRKYGESKYTIAKVPETVGLFFGLLVGKYE